MHYFIDGYNLLFRFIHAGEDLKTQREQLIKELQLKVNLLKLDATLVFDSHFHPEKGSRTHLGSLGLVYTDLGETADEFILQELKECPNPALHTVVTSDKKLAWLCRRRLGKTISAEEFTSSINKRYRNRLRQMKEAARPTLKTLSVPAQPAKKVEPPPENEIPPPKTSPEGCFEYYLETFEEESKKIESQKPARPVKPPKKQKNKPFSKKKFQENAQERFLSDTQRWHTLFERERTENEEL